MPQPKKQAAPQPVQKKERSYKVLVEYYEQAPDITGDLGLIEVKKSEMVEVMRLQRTNKAHTHWAIDLAMEGEPGRMDEVAEEFAKITILSPNKDAVIKDGFACIDLYKSEDVQEDIQSFLGTLGYYQRYLKVLESLAQNQ